MTDSVIAWQRENLPFLRACGVAPACTDQVSVFAPWLWMDERFDTLLESLLTAVLATRYFCGNLKVTVIVNRMTPALEKCLENTEVELFMAPHIRGGSGAGRELNLDSIQNMHTRVDTDYFLTIQHHAFPIRRGLNAFVGRFDYIAAPWKFGKDDWITRCLLHHRHDVGNGAFSLRSRRIHEMASWYFRRKYKLIPFCYLLIDDYFLCKVLPSWERKYRETIKIASPEEAVEFSLEENVTFYEQQNAHPFGFHGPVAFTRLLADRKTPEILTTVQG